MIRHVLALGLTVALTACTISVTPENTLKVDEDFRRTEFKSLSILNGALLPLEAKLRHHWLDSDIGPLALTWARQDEQQPSDRLIIYCMGNATDRQSDGADYLAGILPFGDAVIFDYPGYGDSAGSASLENFEIALTAIAEEINAQPYKEVIVWGHSMGGFLCPLIVESLNVEVEGVVFEATFNDASALARFGVPWYLKPFIRLKIDERLLTFSSANTLKGFDGKVVVLAAMKDKDLPIAALRDLANQLVATGLNVQYLEFENAGHYDIAEQPDYETRVKAALTDDKP